MNIEGQDEVYVYGSGYNGRFTQRSRTVRALLILVASVLLLAIFAVGLALGTTSGDQISQPPPFCCPSEGSQLIAVVNDTLSPCDNLCSYVCADIVMNESGRSKMLFRTTEEVIAGLPASTAERFASFAPSLTSSRAGLFLRGLYSRCVAVSTASAERDKDGHSVPTHFVQMAAALWDMGRKLLVQLNESNLLEFLFMVNLKYRMRSAVEIQYLSSESTLLLYHDALELDSEMHLACAECVAAVLIAYNRNGRRSRPESNGGSQHESNSSSLTFEDVSGFAGRLHSLYPERRIVERYVMANVSQLWPAEQLAKSMSMLFWIHSLAGLSVEAFAPHQLAVLRQQITSSENWAVGAVYLLAHTVARGLLMTPSVLRIDNARRVCLTLTTELRALVHTMYWDLYGSPEKEKIVADMYKSVQEAVALDAASALLVSESVHEVNHPLRTLLSSIALMTGATTHLDAGQVPQALPADFARNLLLGRCFEFEARKNRQKLRLPERQSEADPALILGPRAYLEVPASFYRFLRIARGPDPLNMAVLGVPLAEHLWSAVLQHNWSGDPQENIARITHCFNEASQRGGDELPGTLTNYAQSVRLAAASLALRTIIQVMPQEGLYTARYADGNSTHPRHLSHARFFFLLQAYFRCPGENLIRHKDYINIPSAYAPQFARAFQCPSMPLIDRLRDCVLRRREFA